MNKIILDEWLSTMVKKPAYLLQLIHANLKQKDLPKGKIFIWSKISVGDIRRLICLQKLGFYIVDTNIQFSLSKKISFVNNFNLRFAKPSDESGVRALAKNAFKFSRFYKDPNISTKVACKIKEEWAGNFFLGNRGKWMVVVEENSKVIGFLQLLEKNKNTVVIDLIAIDENKKGKGLAKQMILYAYENCLKKNGIMEVGTQIANISSIKLYSKLGFKMNSATYVLHKHG